MLQSECGAGESIKCDVPLRKLHLFSLLFLPNRKLGLDHAWGLTKYTLTRLHVLGRALPRPSWAKGECFFFLPCLSRAASAYRGQQRLNALSDCGDVRILGAECDVVNYQMIEVRLIFS